MEIDILTGNKPFNCFVNVDDNNFYLNTLNQLNIVDKIVSYAPYYVQSSSPSNPQHGWLWYNTTNNKLYQYNYYKSNWIELDWQTAVRATPEWQAGKLQITSGKLQIADGQANPEWRDCYPLFGAKIYTLNDYTKYYYLFVDDIVVFNNTANINIVYSYTCKAIFKFVIRNTQMYELKVSGNDASSGVHAVNYNPTSTTVAHYENHSSVRLALTESTNYINVGELIFSDFVILTSKAGINTGTYYSVSDRASFVAHATTSYYIGTLTATLNTPLYLERIA